jgi:hypothetical protein
MRADDSRFDTARILFQADLVQDLECRVYDLGLRAEDAPRIPLAQIWWAERSDPAAVGTLSPTASTRVLAS